jgi:hypothetical protein
MRKKQCCGSALVSMRIRIQGAKPMRIRILVSQTNADPDPGLTQKHTYDGTKVFLKGRKPGLMVNFGQFPSS